MEGSHCAPCDCRLTPEEVPIHLESVHIGPRVVDGMILFCGSCNFRVGMDRIHYMISHCRLLKHEVESLRTNWEDFLKAEEERVKEIVRQGILLPSPPPSGEEGSTPEISEIQSPPTRPSDKKPDKTRHLRKRKREADAKPPGPANRPEPGISSSVEERPIHDVSDSPTPEGNTTVEVEEEGLEAEKENMEKNRETGPSTKSFPDPFVPATIEFPRKIDRSLVIPAALDTTLKTTPKQSLNETLGAGSGIVCMACDYIPGRKHKGRLKQDAILHIFSHNRDLRPFKCKGCEKKDCHPGNIKRHATNSAKCDGSYVNIQSEEMILATRKSLLQLYPMVDWDAKVPSGSLHYYIKF